MIELKTLKDIRRCGEFQDDVMPEDLKQEAIKWVKEFETPNDKNYYGTVEEWIKHFFNLTEEDLK